MLSNEGKKFSKSYRLEHYIRHFIILITYFSYLLITNVKQWLKLIQHLLSRNEIIINMCFLFQALRCEIFANFTIGIKKFSFTRIISRMILFEASIAWSALS